MASAEHFPLTYPGEEKRSNFSEPILKRIAVAAGLGSGARVLFWGAGNGGPSLMLAKALGCTVVAADWDAVAVARAEERIKAARPALKVEAREISRASLPFTDSQFDGVIVDERVAQPLRQTLQSLRRLLVPKGRVYVRYPVRVGRNPDPGAMAFWEKKLGEKLLLPRECLGILEESGFEPQSIETESDTDLEDFYRSVELGLDAVTPAQKKALEEEIALHRAMLGRTTVSFARMIGRRKEPGEKPPASRNE